LFEEVDSVSHKKAIQLLSSCWASTGAIHPKILQTGSFTFSLNSQNNDITPYNST